MVGNTLSIFSTVSLSSIAEYGLMKTFLQLVLLVLAMVVLSACTHAPVPVAENFPLTAQKKIRSAGHWDILSQDVVSRTTARLAELGLPQDIPLFVVMPGEPTIFDRAFNDFLITELVYLGYHVTSDEHRASYSIRYHTLLVRHDSPRPHFIPGAATALTAGLLVAHGLGVHASSGEAMAGALGFAALADLGASHYTGGPTANELILTTTVKAADRYLIRSTDVYYIENADIRLFNPGILLQPKALRVVSE